MQQWQKLYPAAVTIRTLPAAKRYYYYDRFVELVLAYAQNHPDQLFIIEGYLNIEARQDCPLIILRPSLYRCIHNCCARGHRSMIRRGVDFWRYSLTFPRNWCQFNRTIDRVTAVRQPTLCQSPEALCNMFTRV